MKTMTRPDLGDDETTTQTGKSAREVASDVRRQLKVGIEAVQTGNKLLRPHRRGLAPTATMAGLWGVGAALDVMPDAWNAWMYPAGLGALALGVSLARPVLHWLRENTPGALWARASVAVGTGWLTAAAAIGADEPTPVALMAGGLVLSVPWWLRYHQRVGMRQFLPPPVVEDAPEEDEEGEPELPQLEAPAKVIWDTQLACANGPFAGCEADLWERVDNGWSASVWVPRDGRLLADEAIAKTHRVTTMLRKRMGEVIMEPHPDCVEGHLRFTLLNRLPLEDGRAWQGPNLDVVTGIMALGPFADGKGDAKIQLFKPGFGMKHTLISGGTGAGKSNLILNIIAAIEHSGVGVTWLADPQGGQSYAETGWLEELDRVALDMDEIRTMIYAAYNVMMKNSAYLRNLEWTKVRNGKSRVIKGRKCLDPTPQMPFLALVIDEAHLVLLDKELAQIVGLIAKMGRKAGVLLILATQTPTQEELGGAHGGPIRDNVLMGNIVVLRTMSRMTASMLSLPVDPSRLPSVFPGGGSTEGIGFVLGSTSREVMMRVDYEADPEQWSETSPRTKLHQAAEEAAMEVFLNPGTAEAQGGDGASAPTRLPGLPVFDQDGGISNVTGLPFPEVEEQLEEARQEDKRAATRITKYLAKCAEGATPSRIATDLGLSRGHVHRVLDDLVAKKQAENDGTGVYCAATAQTAA